MKWTFLLAACALHATTGYLTEEEIALFYKQGYLIKEKALTLQEIKHIDKHVNGAIDQALVEIEKAKPSVLPNEQFVFVEGSRVVYKCTPNIAICRINGCSGMTPALLDSVRSEKLLHTIFDLLGTNEIEHIISQIHPKLPSDQVSFPRHQDIQFRKIFDPDWQDILGNGSYAICIIPVDPMTPENGGLWIDRNNYPEYRGEEEDLIWIYAEPGDILFMHPYLFHGSGPNNSTKSRKTLLTGFCAYGANHKAYPGADINTKVSRLNGEIITTDAPWSKMTTTAPLNGH